MLSASSQSTLFADRESRRLVVELVFVAWMHVADHETVRSRIHDVAVLPAVGDLRVAFPRLAVVVGETHPDTGTGIGADDDAVLQRDQARIAAAVGHAVRDRPGLAAIGRSRKIHW